MVSLSRLQKPRLFVILAALLAAAAALYTAPFAGANHGDIHAHCVGDRPVITSRPPGTGHILVICQDGLPEFMVRMDPVPTYDPVTEAMPRAIPPDFGGWVTVWLNGHPLLTPYDPVRRVQEPGAYLAASTGRVMMPVRFFTEAFGGQVEWAHEERRARLFMYDQGQVIQLWAGREGATVGARIEHLDQPPVLFQERMFVPVRFLAEGFGAEVVWDHANRSAQVELKGARCVSPVYCGEVR